MRLNLLGELLPGVRGVRGPLVAGYIWLFAAWVLLGDELPDEATSPEVFTVGDVLGAGGIAIVASIAAYLLGSLIQAWISAGAELVTRLVQRPRRFPRRLGGRLSINELLEDPIAYAPLDLALLNRDRGTKAGLEDLIIAQLMPSRERMRAAGQRAQARAGERREVGFLFGYGSAALGLGALTVAVLGPQRIEFCQGEQFDQPLQLPSFSTRRDLFGQLSTLKTRLMEVAGIAGSEVERLYSEAEFRLTVSVPLAVAALAMSSESGDTIWRLLIAASVGLLAHAFYLYRQAGREMIDVLRSRDGTELEQITSVFKRYRERADAVTAILDRTEWEPLGEAFTERWEGHPSPTE